MAGNDPGAIENRLSLNPNDERWADLLADWEDGQRYKVMLEIEQKSPGEFEVAAVESHDEKGEGEETPDAGGERKGNPSEPSGESDYPNPAVRKMMDAEQAAPSY